MLDVSVKALTLPPLRDVDLTFQRGSHTIITGAAGSGISTLLRVLAGASKPRSGTVHIGNRDVTSLASSKRPLLYVTSGEQVPGRWSVQHALVAAARGRTLDRIDRQREYLLAVEKWGLQTLVTRRMSALSTSERTLVNLARIELLRPGILVADRLLEGLTLSGSDRLASEFYRTLRVLGTTVIASPASRVEMGMSDSVVVLDEGRVAQRGSAAELFQSPATEAVARATGAVNVIPVTIRGNEVESPMGIWEITEPPFQGDGVALVRPGAFSIPAAGSDSDLIFGIEEAGFQDGQWSARGYLSGGVELTVLLPGNANVHKGKLLALRYDAPSFKLLSRAHAPMVTIPVDVIAPMRDSS